MKTLGWALAVVFSFTVWAGMGFVLFQSGPTVGDIVAYVLSWGVILWISREMLFLFVAWAFAHLVKFLIWMKGH